MMVSCPGTIAQVVRLTLALEAAAPAAGFPLATAASGPGDFKGGLASPVLDTSRKFIGIKLESKKRKIFLLSRTLM